MVELKTEPKKLSRIQQRNRDLITDAGLNVFSQYGFRGATLDQIAEASGLSKPNILYYFTGKEDIYVTLLNRILDGWLDPLDELDPNGDPISEIVAYVERKMEMSRKYPRESRLFANEIIQGGTRVLDHIEVDIKPQIDAKIAVIQGWIDTGQLAQVDARHLLTSIWATTQHYADFEAQTQLFLGDGDRVLTEGTEFLTALFRKALQPG
ncbi:MAG: TetR family transcriptional regulator C-terminal domain-containing protein [Pseudomonadota bacterium]|nr:TetR family transcriptional regulator C-terminal domain-containing protein [Pseudomonadota bacterium]MEE3360251.1 TetR family transcriptional regulator C-terminal domain-containing protein [Pseudomonadota bacterium]